MSGNDKKELEGIYNWRNLSKFLGYSVGGLRLNKDDHEELRGELRFFILGIKAKYFRVRKKKSNK